MTQKKKGRNSMVKEPERPLCLECDGKVGTGLLIQGAAPEHKGSDHWRLVAEHAAAKNILGAVVELVGIEAVVRYISSLGRATDPTRRLLNKLFRELAEEE